MSLLASLFGGGIAQPIEAIGNVVDKVFTSDEERLQAAAVMEKLRQHPAELQVELNKVEAAHRSVWVAGARPFIMWVCGLGLANMFLINPWLQWWTGTAGPALPHDVMLELTLAMLGFAALRSAEKVAKVTK